MCCVHLLGKGNHPDCRRFRQFNTILWKYYMLISFWLLLMLLPLSYSSFKKESLFLFLLFQSQPSWILGKDKSTVPLYFFLSCPSTLEFLSQLLHYYSNAFLVLLDLSPPLKRLRLSHGVHLKLTITNHMYSLFKVLSSSQSWRFSYVSSTLLNHCQ